MARTARARATSIAKVPKTPKAKSPEAINPDVIPIEMPYSFELRLRRETRRDSGFDKYMDMINILVDKVNSVEIQKYWLITPALEVGEPTPEGAAVYLASILFTRKKNRLSDEARGRQESNVLEDLRKRCEAAKWSICNEKGEVVTASGWSETNPFEGEFVSFAEFNTYFYSRDDQLVGAKDEIIRSSPYFRDLFGVEAHIRLMLDAINTAVETNGEVCHHIILHGDPGAGKSSIASALGQYLSGCIPIDRGARAHTAINIDSTTSAGLERAFLDRWARKTGVPPFIIFEEGEKVHQNVWKCMLGALDHRKQIHKINARRADITPIYTFAICVVNDIEAFDHFLGGRTVNGKLIPGALSSRFSTRIEVARPDDVTMKKIIMREIDKYEWNPAWADAALDLAKRIGTDDPREILRLLDGKNRLLDDTYAEDIVRTRRAKEINRATYATNQIETDTWWASFYGVPNG